MIIFENNMQYEDWVNKLFECMKPIQRTDVKLTKLQLEQQYRDYSVYEFQLNSNLTYKHILNENSGIHVKPENVINFLKARFRLKDWQFQPDSFNNTDGIVVEYDPYKNDYKKDFTKNELFLRKIKKDKDIIFSIPDIKRNKQIIVHALNKFGYYLACSSKYTVNNHDWFTLCFQSIYSDNVNDIVKKKKYIYHITTLSNTKNIIKNGFIPKSLNNFFNYPKRIHFFISDKERAKQFRNDFTKYSNNEKFVLFTVDTSKLNNIDFYPDPNMEDAVFTKVPVSKNAIVDVEEF